MSVKIRIKNRRVYLDIYHNGIRKWEALKISLSTDKETNREILKVAEICRARKELQILTNTWGLTDPVGGEISLVSYMEKIAEKSNRSKRQQINSTVLLLKKFQGGGAIRLKQITPLWVQRVQEYLEKECNLKSASSNSYEVMIRAAIKKAVKENLITADPTIGIKTIKIKEPDKIYLTSSEIIKLVNAELNTVYSGLVKRAFLFACNTGLRISDLISLKWENIEHDPLQIIKRQEKTGEKVYIPLNNNAWHMINDGKIHNHAEPVFNDLYKYKNTDFIKKLGRAAGIEKKIGWHTARHTFAVLSLESGADLYTVSKLLGHTDIKTTQVYAKATDKMKRAAVDALPELKVN